MRPPDIAKMTSVLNPASSSVPTPSSARLDTFARSRAEVDMGPRLLQTPIQAMTTIEERQVPLDGLERRSPSGGAARPSGALTGGTSLSFVDGSPVGRTTIDGDELTRGRGR